jgi:endothelin-converting enzyme/putative endopeptidase
MSQSIYMPMCAMVLLIAIVWVRLYIVRIGEMRARRIRPQDLSNSVKAAGALQNVTAADNFRNLFEVPVLFFVVCLAIAASNRVSAIQVTLAWIYVILRAMHTFIHIGYNRVIHRFYVYAASTIVVFIMWVLFALSVIPMASAAESVAPPQRMHVGQDKPLEQLPYTPSLDVSSMDRSVDPCDDLYMFACGGWIKNNPIPPDQNRWDVYAKLTLDNQKYLWGILEDAAKAVGNRTPTQQKIGDYFASCMDTEAVEKAGLAPLKEDLERIGNLKNKKALAAYIGDLHQRISSNGVMFGAGVQQDAKDASKQIAVIDAGGLGLPDRDYYLKTDAKSVETRQRYLEHVTMMFKLLGEPTPHAKADADTVMRIETALAKASLTKVDRRDPYKIYHRQTLAGLPKLAPAFDWPAYFKEVGMNPAPWLNVTEPAFFKELNARLTQERLADLKTYLRWGLLSASAPYLSSPFVNESFAFNRKYLRGVEEDRPRWKKCVAWVDRDLGDALGREFVDRAFPPAMKEKTVRMTQQIEAAMKTRIEQLDWMAPQTKEQAIAKLAKVRNKVGYPDLWRDYSSLTIERSDFFENVTRAIRFESLRQAAKIGKPVDRGEWQMSAPTVNAYYDPAMNDVNFPAGVLSPPLFDVKMDDAPNYGNTGATIGHELTHGFDDEGRQYDGDGNLRDWWTKEDAEKFEKRAQCIRDQYSQYTIVDDIRINGALTSGEDIADLGGELVAWMAWQEQTKAMRLAEKDGLTPSQRFFVGMAQWACSNERPENMRVGALTDPHSPSRYRINGVVVNMPEFAQAFSCKAGKKLVKRPEDVCKVW